MGWVCFVLCSGGDNFIFFIHPYLNRRIKKTSKKAFRTFQEHLEATSTFEYP